MGCSRCGTVIEIATLADLQAVSNDLAGHYRLVSDIDATDTKNWHGGRGFVPLGEAMSNAFAGVFDGNGHIIRNLWINRPYGVGIGLFGGINGGQVRNVIVVEADVVGKMWVGLLVGHAFTADISASRVSGTVLGACSLGGLVGEIDYGSAAQCSAAARVTAVGMGIEGILDGTYAHHVGGLIGCAKAISISACRAEGEASGIAEVGGLVGCNEGTIEECEASTRVSGESNIGGLVGTNDGEIAKSGAVGPVVGREGQAGGLVGYAGAKSLISSSRSLGVVSGKSDVGGLVGWNEGAIDACHASGDVKAWCDAGNLVGRQRNGTATNSQGTGVVAGSAPSSWNIGGQIGLEG
jgi:hypothetical protein